ncbi:hypothetical protein [Streptomyces sp. bgisy022]|uniref:hypothetical protein n=1 Tax=Streptomyces sp. bgisy022 TaxID=3413769 RepID=UPI003D76460F
MGVGVGVGVGGGAGGEHFGGRGQVILPATATASVPSGPVEAYAQASADAAPGTPRRAQPSAAAARARATRAEEVGTSPCTTKIMRLELR